MAFEEVDVGIDLVIPVRVRRMSVGRGRMNLGREERRIVSSRRRKCGVKSLQIEV